MNLPQKKIRNGREFMLIRDYHSKLDAERKLKELRTENACFARKEFFIFSSANPEIEFNHGIYEKVYTGQTF